MNTNSLISRVKKSRPLFGKQAWYKQAGAVKPLYLGYPAHACLGFTVHGRRISLNYTPFGWYLWNDFFDVYFSRETLHNVASFYYEKEQRSPGFIERLRSAWLRGSVATLRRTINTLANADFSLLTQKELFQQFFDFSSHYEAVWQEAIFHDAFDVAGERLLSDAIKKEGKSIDDEDIVICTTPEQWSSLQKERADLLRIARLMKKKKHSPYVTAALDQHVAMYHWIRNDYAVIQHLDRKFFLKEVRHLLRNPSQMQKEQCMLATVLALQKKRARVAQRLRLSRQLRSAFTLLRIVAEWRDTRKAINQTASAVLERFAEEFSRRFAIRKQHIEYCWWWELPGILREKDRVRKEYTRRKDGVFIIGHQRKHRFIYGARGKRLHSFFEKYITKTGDLRGRSAFPGVVRGKARVVLSQKDFSKMKKGDILVAPNTRPEYVPIMKIAGAIVSEEGGLTCHTAIVSRELHIPTIVGVQGVIAALKNGDWIEVDAKTGIVKKIK